MQNLYLQMIIHENMNCGFVKTKPIKPNLFTLMSYLYFKRKREPLLTFIRPAGINGLKAFRRSQDIIPDIVKESYVYQHLHFKPSLANYTPRPAVHWFSYSDLCKLGRQAGFAQFYSLLDLVDDASPYIWQSKLRRYLLRPMQRCAWFRGMVLTQAGGTIFMLKRPK